MQVNVYFKTLSTHMVTESPSYEGITIIYAFGGALSLWLGISLIAIFEIVELCIRLTYALCVICSQFLRQVCQAVSIATAIPHARHRSTSDQQSEWRVIQIKQAD